MYGKAIIEAHNNESMQRWGGIIPSIKILSEPKNVNIITNSYVKYDIKRILKDSSYSNNYLTNITEINSPKYVLDWIKIYKKLYEDDPDWLSLFKEAEKIQDNDQKKSAKEKICNTKRFYEWYLESIKSKIS